MNDALPADPPIDKLSLMELHAADVGLAETMDLLKAQRAVVAEEISRRLGASAAEAFKQAGKAHGTLTLPLQGGLSAKCEIGKKVEWDSEKLLALAQTMPWETVTRTFKIAFSVPEKIYDGIAAINTDLKAKIDTARTVKLAPVKITLQLEG